MFSLELDLPSTLSCCLVLILTWGLHSTLSSANKSLKWKHCRLKLKYLGVRKCLVHQAFLIISNKSHSSRSLRSFSTPNLCLSPAPRTYTRYGQRAYIMEQSPSSHLSGFISWILQSPNHFKNSYTFIVSWVFIICVFL